jgi:sulfur relay (sulfurtransferase) DsrC/TusE family protein
MSNQLKLQAWERPLAAMSEKGFMEQMFRDQETTQTYLARNNTVQITNLHQMVNFLTKINNSKNKKPPISAINLKLSNRQNNSHL